MSTKNRILILTVAILLATIVVFSSTAAQPDASTQGAEQTPAWSEEIMDYGAQFGSYRVTTGGTLTDSEEAPPDISVIPASFNVYLTQDDQRSELMSIRNVGGELLEFSIFDVETSTTAPQFTGRSGFAGGPEARSLARATADLQASFGMTSTANPVLIIQDVLPWGFDSIQQVLTANGIGYDQVNSTQIATINLSPYNMVIIPSVQLDTFYNTWNANIARFDAYVSAGGRLWQSTCNQSGVTEAFMIPLLIDTTRPISSDDFEDYNDLLELDHPWVEGVPNPVTGSSASQDSFTNLYPGTVVVAQAQNTGLPTLVDYNVDAGRVLVTGQTLELAWEYGWDGAPILENSLLDMYRNSMDAPWLTESPTSGSVPAEGRLDVLIDFDATGLSFGTYTADIHITSNDPDEPALVVPVTMEVVPVTPASLRIVPALLDVPRPGEASVDVIVEDVANLHELSMMLTFDPSYVEVVDADPTLPDVQIMPGNCPSPDSVIMNSSDNATGVINYNVESLAPSPQCTGTGLVATITFRGLNSTTTSIPLHFTNWLLVDSSGFALPTNVFHGEINVFELPGAIEGWVELQGRVDHSLTDVCAWAGPSLANCILTNAAGYFELTLPGGSYSIRAETGRYLDAEKLSVTCIAGSTTTLNPVMLWGGDANDDCTVNILDLSFMGARYLCTSADPCYDAKADINNDGTINIQDIVLGGGNYLRSCWVTWP